jgi:hypothetical protein
LAAGWLAVSTTSGLAADRTSDPAGSAIHVAPQTPVTVHVKSAVSSSRAQAGDTIALQVADDVVVNGYIVIARGADGLAEVTSATPAGANSNGQLAIQYKWVRAVDGSKIGVTGTSSLAARSNSNDSDPATTLSDGSNAAQSAGITQAANYLQRVSGVFKNLTAHAKGNDISLEPDRTISLEIRNPAGVSIISSQRSSQPTTTANDDADVK